jgi:hypothetical protein
MQRIEMNIHKKELCVKLVIYKDYAEMQSQQNIKKYKHTLSKHLSLVKHIQQSILSTGLAVPDVN